MITKKEQLDALWFDLYKAEEAGLVLQLLAPTRWYTFRIKSTVDMTPDRCTTLADYMKTTYPDVVITIHTDGIYIRVYQ